MADNTGLKEGTEEECESAEDEEEEDIVILTDAEGNEVEYQLLAIVEVDGENYALLTPDEEEAESTEVFIFRYEQDEDGGDVYSDVEDEATFAKVQAEAEKLFQETEEN